MAVCSRLTAAHIFCLVEELLIKNKTKLNYDYRLPHTIRFRLSDLANTNSLVHHRL